MGKTKFLTIAAILLLLFLSATPAAADIGIVDSLSDIVKGGLDKFIRAFADRFYEIGYHPPGQQIINGSGTEVFIYALTTATVDPWKKESVRDMLFTTWYYVFVIATLYASNGLLYLLMVFLSPGAADTFDGILGRGVSMRSIRTKQYFQNLLTSIGILGFMSTLMQLLFTISLALTTLCLLSCMAIKPLAVSADNLVLYAMIGLFYAVLSWFFLVRGLLLYMFVAGSLLIGALMISNYTRKMGIHLFTYFAGVLFMQPIIVFVMALGFLATEALFGDMGIIGTSVGGLVIYLGLLYVLLKVTMKLLFGIKKYSTAAVTAVKLVI